MSYKHTAPPQAGVTQETRSPRRRFNTADLRGAPPADAFKLPVAWRDATILLVDGSRHCVRLSVGPDESIRDLFEAQEPFFPVLQADTFRLYPRAALACVTVKATETADNEGAVPIMSRGLRVSLVSGVTLEGRLDFVPIHGRTRVTDVLNEPVTTFCLHHSEGVSHVAKAHVLFVEEHA